MERTVFLNGEFMPEGEATVPIFDRGLLFADSVYEGFGILDSQIVDYEYHMNRLGRSLGELVMPWPMARDELLVAMMKLIEMNNAVEGFMYLQVTRGSRDRSYLYDDQYEPTVFAFTQKEKFAADAPPALRVAFHVRVWGGGGVSATGATWSHGDGFSVSYGQLTTEVLGEFGGGGGLRVAFRTRALRLGRAAPGAARCHRRRRRPLFWLAPGRTASQSHPCSVLPS